MPPTIQSLPSRLVIGVGGGFFSVLSPKANNFEVIPKLWHESINRFDEIPARKSPQALGCVWCLENKDELYYLACVEVASIADVPAGMEAREIPAGDYAVFVHKGRLDTLGQTMGFIYGTWLPGSGHRRRNAPDVEVYGPKFDKDSDTSELEICIPIQ